MKREGEWNVEERAYDGVGDWATLARENRTLEGNWKYVMDSSSDTVMLRREELAAGDEGTGTPRERLAEMGYEMREREGRVLVRAGAEWVEMEESGEGEATFSMTEAGVDADWFREAAALYVLRAGGQVRMARGFLGSGGEMGFLARARDGELEAALGAVAYCARLLQKPTGVLRNEAAARAYLATAGAGVQT